MKRIFAVLIAIVLICSVIPAVDISAAASPALNTNNRLIYVGGSTVLKGTYSKGYYTLKVKNKASKYSCSWSTSTPDVVSVEKKKGGKAKVTALKPGKAVVTATYFDKTAKTQYSLRATFTVVSNTSAVEISGYDNTKLKIGTSIRLSATQYDSTGNKLEPGKDTNDFVKWVSSNNKIATVSDDGVVTAVDAGKAEITCYVVQAESGKYSKKSKATALKKIIIDVAEPDISGISAVTPHSLDSLSVTLGSDKLGALTSNNFNVKLNNNSYITVKNIIQKDKTVILKLDRALTEGGNYSVVLKNTKATVDLEGSCTFTMGTPVSVGVTTPIEGDRVIANRWTPLKFILYNAQGCDITPLDEKSKKYKEYAMCVRYDVVNSTDGSANDTNVFVYDEGKDVSVKVTFSSGVIYGASESIDLTNVGVLHSVNEGETVTFDPTKDVVYDSQIVEGSKLSFNGKDIKIPINDDSLNYIIARVKGFDGKYMYSNDLDTRMSFESVTTNVCSISSNGRVEINQNKSTGSDTIKLLFNRIEIGRFTIYVTEATQVTNMTFEVGGKSADSYIAADSPSAGTTKVIVKLFDQNGTIIKPRSYDNIMVDQLDEGPWVSLSLDSSGNACMGFETYGFGTMDGKLYRYKVTYSDTNRGTIEKVYNLIIKTSLSSITSTYSLDVSSQVDLSTISATSELPKLDLKLIEFKESVFYKQVTPVYPADSTSIRDKSFFYKLFKTDSGYEIEVDNENALKTDKILCAYKNADGEIEKLESGSYLIRVYQKTSSGVYDIASGTFVITDNEY